MAARSSQRDLGSLAEAIARHALSLPEAWEDFPWEDRTAKVGKKIFAFLGTTGMGLKLPQSAPFALSLGCAKPMAYGLGKHGWVSIDLEHPSAPELETLLDWVDESYRALAPKKLVKLLDARSAP